MRKRQLGSELRRLRKAADLTQEAVARHLRGDRSGLSNHERGHTCPSPRTLSLLLDLYGATDEERAALVALRNTADARISGEFIPESYQEYILCEERASHLSFFELTLIPGPLQIPRYVHEQARCALPNATAEELDGRVSARLRRQANFFAGTATIDVILYEAAILCAVGGPDVMVAQLRHLIEIAEGPNVSVRILPFSVGAHASMSASFVILDFPQEPPVVALESPFDELFQDDKDEIDRFRELWASLLAKTLSPRDSTELIADSIECFGRKRICSSAKARTPGRTATA